LSARIKKEKKIMITVEYKMSETMANEIIKAAKKKGNKRPPQEILVNYVNNQYSLLRTCVRVIVG
jgi:hypothetical protein